MTRRVVLDATAVQALLDPGHPSRRQVRAAMEAAARLHHQVWVAAVTLAELYRSAPRNRAVDALLSRESGGLRVRDTDLALARLVGGLLTGGGMGSEHLADAHAVAVAVESGGVVLTGDLDDLGRLAGPYAHVTVVELRDSRVR